MITMFELLYARQGVLVKSLRTMTVIFAAAVLVLTNASTALAQKPEAGVQVPKYDLAAEATYKGTVQEVRNRQCPVSGGMGSHLILKLSAGNTIEVHLASTKFAEKYDLIFNKGDAVTVVGTKVQFEGVETIFARTVVRGSETYLLRDKSGMPVW